jgi:hypothetical protein
MKKPPLLAASLLVNDVANPGGSSGSLRQPDLLIHADRQKHHRHFERSEKSAFYCAKNKQISHPIRPGSK